MITFAEKKFLLDVARETLTAYLQMGEMPHWQTHSPNLLEPRAVFVTLRVRKTGDLRGCRGETQAKHSLIDSVVRMTVASATDDPRFPAVELSEVPLLHIEINALTALTPIHTSEIEIGRHGLMIVKGNHAGLLLPEVAARYKWDPEHFLCAVCHKAGLHENAWATQGAQLFGFETEAWGEQ